MFLLKSERYELIKKTTIVTRGFNSTTATVLRNGDRGRDHLENQDIDYRKIFKQDLYLDK